MDEKNLKEKIKRWAEELEKNLKRKGELDKKIEELKTKISEARNDLEAIRNKKIAGAVEEIFGDIDVSNLDDFKLELMEFVEEKNKKSHGNSEGWNDYFELDAADEAEEK